MIPMPWQLWAMYWQGRSAVRYAKERDGLGMAFDDAGRRAGLRLLLKGVPLGIVYWLAPINLVRYFEFPFVLSCLPNAPVHCLDVSSPRLFSFFVASQYPHIHIRMINPDAEDLLRSQRSAQSLGLRNISVECIGVDYLVHEPETYDCIWAISVVEHISGQFTDSQAVAAMYQALKPGGRLILTVPVDRQFRVEFRDHDPYGLQAPSGKGFFFQNVYDQQAIVERLLAPTQREPLTIRWFGESIVGHYAAYEKHWLRKGWPHAIEDARIVADYYREFTDWADMPGMGVCGMALEKPLH